jgi:hypothetical protein
MNTSLILEDIDNLINETFDPFGFWEVVLESSELSSDQKIELLIEDAKNQDKKGNNTLAMLGAAGIAALTLAKKTKFLTTLLTWFKSLSIGKTFAAQKLYNAAKIGKAGGGAVLISKDENLNSKWQDEVRDTAYMALRSAAISSTIQIIIGLLSGWAASSILTAVGIVSLMVTLYSIIYKVVLIVINKHKKNPLVQNEKALLIATIVGVVGYTVNEGLTGGANIGSNILMFFINFMINADWNKLLKGKF